MTKKTKVYHWEYQDGWITIPDNFRGRGGRDFKADLVGWHCWVYPANDIIFENWMKQNMKGKYESIHRFNSGNPMYTVHIHEGEDATLFRIMWM